MLWDWRRQHVVRAIVRLLLQGPNCKILVYFFVVVIVQLPQPVHIVQHQQNARIQREVKARKGNITF